MSRPSAELRPQLEQAQDDLHRALREACDVDVRRADTGELIRVDELLAIAGESAKKAISVRRRLHESSSTSSASSSGSGSGTTVMEAIGIAPSPSRVFEDDQKRRWTTFAVRPTKSSSDRARLPQPFQTGWLSFDSGTETRRLTPIPDHWSDLTDAELRELCAKAIVATRRGRPKGD